VASHLPIYRNYERQWTVFKDVLDWDLHQLDVSSCQECGRQSARAASPSIDPLCGTVDCLLCATAGYHWTRSDGSEESSFRTVVNITRRHCDVFCHSSVISKCHNLLTYIIPLTLLVVYRKQRFVSSHSLPIFDNHKRFLRYQDMGVTALPSADDAICQQ